MRIRFHYTYFLIASSFILCGYFINLIVFTSIILVHELGHLLMAKFSGLKVGRLTIYPYGGLLELDIKINTPIWRELLVALGGVVSQTLFYIMIILLYNIGLIREYVFNLFKMYYCNILLFNLLPIHPLDGSKIMRLILDYFLPYRIVNIINIIISIITGLLVVIFNIYKWNYTWVMIGGVVVDNLIKYYRDLNYYFNRFLLERYLYKYHFLRRKVIKNVNAMQRDKYHFFYEDGNYKSEKQVLLKKFLGNR